MAIPMLPNEALTEKIEANVSFRMVDLCRLVERYMSEEDSRKVYDAFMLAADAHDGVIRKSGEPYITHPLEVARILADLHLDADSICAALLHDVIEDTNYTYDDIAKDFGETVADLVEGVTKLSSSKFKNKEAAGVASFQKMMRAMIKDYRVVLIKLADRLHNVQTLGVMRPEKQRRIAKETLEIHVPLARRMGMNSLRHSLQTYAFERLYPNRSAILKKWWHSCLEENAETHRNILKNISNALEQSDLNYCTVFPWEKNLYRHYEKEKGRRAPYKLDRGNVSFDIRVLTKTTLDCYKVLGIIHQLYHPKMGELKDFISVPKVYGFQALQTVVITDNRDIISIQIQSQDMYQVAQYGITAQWRFPHLGHHKKIDMSQRRLSMWLEQVKEIQQATGNPEDFMEDMKADFFLREVSVMTPKGDAKALRAGATPVDFAYAIHTDVGHHCISAFIDGQHVPLNTQLHDGATVRIFTDSKATPHPSWLNFVVTGKARSAIRNWLTSRKQDEFISLGKDLLESALNRLDSSFDQVKPKKRKKVLKLLDLKNKKQLFSEIAKGNQCSKLIARRLLDNTGLQTLPEDEDAPFMIKGTQGLAVHLGECCHPIPTDTIVAHIEATKGLQIHRSDCARLKQISDADKLTTAWATQIDSTFLVPIQIYAKNEVGVLFTITNTLKRDNINIEDLNITGDRERKELRLLIKIKNQKHLKELINTFKAEPAIYEVSRLYNLSSGNKI